MPQDNNESLNWKDSIVSTITVKGQSEPSFIKIEHKEIKDSKWEDDKESWIMKQRNTCREQEIKKVTRVESQCHKRLSTQSLQVKSSKQSNRKGTIVPFLFIYRELDTCFNRGKGGN